MPSVIMRPLCNTELAGRCAGRGGCRSRVEIGFTFADDAIVDENANKLLEEIALLVSKPEEVHLLFVFQLLF
jgi:hypothetical protein